MPSPRKRRGQTRIDGCGTSKVSRLKVSRSERVAGVDRALLEPDVEPATALRRRAVREAVGHDLSSSAALQRVVADRRRGLQRGFDVAWLEKIPFLLRLVGPDAGEAVGLQLDLHLD